MTESNITPTPEGQTQAESKKEKPKRSWRRRLLRWSGIFLLIICLLPFGLLVSWQISFVRRPLVQFGLSFAETALGGKIELGELRGDLISSLVLEKLKWTDRHGKVMVSLEKLEAYYDLVAYLQKGELLITKVNIVKPYANLTTHYYGFSPGKGGTTSVKRLNISTPEEKKQAEQTYALVQSQINLLTHVKPILPYFCRDDAACGKTSLCKPFSKSPPPAFKEWKGTCVSKPVPKPKNPAKSTFKLRLVKAELSGLHASFTPGPKAAAIKADDLGLKATFSMNGPKMEATLSDMAVKVTNPNVAVRELKLKFAMVDNKISVDDLVLLFGKRSELKADAGIVLAKDLGIKAKLKRVFVAPEDLKPIVPAYPVAQDILLKGTADGSLGGLTAKISATAGKLKLDLDAKSSILQQTYDVDLKLRDIDLADLLGKKGLKSDLGIRLQAKGKGFSDATDGVVSLDVGQGSFQKYKLKSLTLRALLKDRWATVKKLDVKTPYGNIGVKARAHIIKGDFNAQIDGNFPNLRRLSAAIGQKMGGAASLRARVYGQKWMPIKPTSVALRVRRFWHPSARVSRADIDVTLSSLAPKIKALLKLSAKGVKAGGQNIKKAILALNYEMDGPMQKVSLKKIDLDIGTGPYKLDEFKWVRGRRRRARTKLSFDTKRMIARVDHLWLRRFSERIRIDGWIDVKKWRQDLRVEIMRLNLGALARVLPPLKKMKLAGLVGLKVGFKGSFARPQLDLKLKLKKGRFQKFENLTTELTLQYATKAQRYRQRLRLDLDQEVGGVRLVKMRSSLPVGIALRGSLPGPLLLANPAVRLDLNKPVSLDVEVPGVELAKFQKLIGFKLKGWFRLKVELKRRMRDPRFRLLVRLKDGAFRQYSVTKQTRGTGKTKRIMRIKRRSIDIKKLGLSLLINYSRGNLYFQPDANWVRHDKSNLVTLSGRLPLSIKVFSRRRKFAFAYGLVPGKPIDFELSIPNRRLREFAPLMPASLAKQVKSFKGIFGAKVGLKGLPLRPQIFVDVGLSRASLCPIAKGTFQCVEKLSPYLIKRKVRPKSLRVSGVNFGFKVRYLPPPAQAVVPSPQKILFRKPGSLKLSGFLRVREDTLFSISDKLSFLGKEYETGIPLAFSIHPKTLIPFYRLFTNKPARFKLEIPRLDISGGRTFCSGKKRRGKGKPAILDFVRLPILRRLKGRISLEVLLRNELEKPQLSVAFRLRKGAYLFSCDGDGRAKWLDGLKSTVKLIVNYGAVIASVQADVLRKPVIRSQVQLDLKAGLKGILNERTGTTSYKTQVEVGRKMYARLLICRFKLQTLGKLGGFFKKLSGMIQGQVRLKGDPACPVFLSEQSQSRNTPSSKVCEGIEQTSHILLTDLVLGAQSKKARKVLRRLSKKKPPPSLRISRLRLDLSSIKRGQTRVEIVGKQQICARHKVDAKETKGAAGRAKLKKLISLSKKYCPGKKISAPRRAGFPWWLWKVKNSDLMNIDFKGTLPIKLTSIKPKEAPNRCPHWGGKKPSKALFVNMIIPGIPLEFVEAFVPGLKMNAYLGASVKLEGTDKTEPVVRAGQVNLDIKRLKYPAYGVHLLSEKYPRKGAKKRRKSLLRLIFKKSFYEIKGDLQGIQGTPLTIRGKAQHKRFVPKSFDIAVKANDFQPMATPKFKLALNTNIKITQRASKNGDAPLRVKGDIVLPQTLYTLELGGGGPSTYKEDDDIIVIGEPSEKRLLKSRSGRLERPPSNNNLNVDLRIKIPRNFVVRSRELQIEARTNKDLGLRVKLNRGFLQLEGGVEIIRGELSQFGKRFTVKSGSRVLFTGQNMPLSEIGSRIDPRLRVAAVYLVTVAKNSSLAKKGNKKVKVYLLIGGSAQAPKITFEVKDAFTDQVIPMDKVNVIALILTGSTTDDLSSGQQQNLASQAYGVVGRLVASELRNQLSGVVPLDVLNIETGSRPEDLKLEVGRYLTPDVYFQFSIKPIPLEEESYWDVLVDLAINRQWSLELNAGQMKRNDSALFRGGGHVYFRMKY